MKQVWFAAGLAALLAAPSAGRAQAFISAPELVKACAANSRETASCSGFIAGALDETDATPELKGKICLPPGTKLGSIRQSLASFAQERPDAARGSGAELLNAMLTSRFPCRK